MKADADVRRAAEGQRGIRSRPVGERRTKRRDLRGSLRILFAHPILLGRRAVGGTHAEHGAPVKIKYAAGFRNSARVLFEHEIKRTHDVARVTANRFSIRDAIRADNIPLLTSVLRDVRENERLDILSLTDPNGTMIVRSFADASTGDRQDLI